MGLFTDRCTNSECGHRVRKGSQFCPKCGAPGPKGLTQCGSCRAEVRTSSKYCWRCGADLSKVAKPLILEGGATADSLSSILKDMAWDKLKGATRLEICALYNTPPVVAGWVEAAGDSSAYAEHALRQYYQQAIFPTLDFLLPAIQEIVSRFDARLIAWFDAEDQPVVQQMRLARIDSAQKLFAMGRPFGDIDNLLDLGMPRRDWDETGFLAANLMSIDQVMQVGGVPPLNEGPEEEETDTDSQTRKGEPEERTLKGEPIDKAVADRIWDAWQRSWAPLAKRAAGLFAARVSVQGRQAIKLLKAYLQDDKDAKSQDVIRGEKDSEVIARILFEIFDDEGEKRRWITRYQPITQDAYELGARQSLTEAGLTDEALETTQSAVLNNPAITQSIKADTARITAKVDARTRFFLRRTLNEGMEAGEDVRRLADRVQTYVQSSRKGALTQARNYVGQSLSKARREGRVAAGVTHEIWVHSRGPGERREAHIAAEAHYAKNPKRTGEMWNINGAYLAYPRDPSGPPAETINCQCFAIGKRLAPKESANNTNDSKGETDSKSTDSTDKSEIGNWNLTIKNLLLRGFVPYRPSKTGKKE